MIIYYNCLVNFERLQTLMSTFASANTNAVDTVETIGPSHRVRRLNKDTGLSAESKTSAPHGNMYQNERTFFPPHSGNGKGPSHDGTSAMRITGIGKRGREVHGSSNQYPRKRFKTRETLKVNIPAGTFYNNTNRINDVDRRIQHISPEDDSYKVEVSGCTRFRPSQDTLSELGRYVAVRVYCDRDDPSQKDVNVGGQETMTQEESLNHKEYKYECCAYRCLEEEFGHFPTKELVPLETRKFQFSKTCGKGVSFFSMRVEDLKPTKDVIPTEGHTVHSKSIVYISTDDLGAMKRFLRSWDPYSQAESDEQKHCVGVGYVYAYELWNLWYSYAPVPPHHDPYATVPPHHARRRR